MEGKCRDFFVNYLIKYFGGKLFGFVMPDVAYNYLIFRVKELVVFKIGSQKNISSGCNCIPQKETARTTTKGNFFNGFLYLRSMLKKRHFKNGFYPLKKRHKFFFTF